MSFASSLPLDSTIMEHICYSNLLLSSKACHRKGSQGVACICETEILWVRNSRDILQVKNLKFKNYVIWITSKEYSETSNVYMFDLRGDFGGRNERAGR